MQRFQIETYDRDTPGLAKLKLKLGISIIKPNDSFAKLFTFFFFFRKRCLVSKLCILASAISGSSFNFRTCMELQVSSSVNLPSEENVFQLFKMHNEEQNLMFLCIYPLTDIWCIYDNLTHGAHTCYQMTRLFSSFSYTASFIIHPCKLVLNRQSTHCNCCIYQSLELLINSPMNRELMERSPFISKGLALSVKSLP